MKYKVLIIDDEESVGYSIKRILETEENIESEIALSGKIGLEMYEAGAHDIVISDLIMGEMNGLEVLKKIKEKNKDAVVIMITGKGSENIAAESIKNGAYDYFSKPFDYIDFFKTIRNAKEKIKLKREKADLEKANKEHTSFYRLDYKSKEMGDIVTFIKKISVTDCSVLINGESGTGKELIAESIHNNSPRKDNPFIKINCGAIPENLMESEIFGYEKGAFTGANSSKKGKLELADRGTIFLDEIGEMSLDLQVKLLRVLEDGMLDKVGATHPKKIDVRIIAATNVNLEKAIENKEFRLDLYYRLNVFKIKVPPLRERKEDIIFLAERMISEYSDKFGMGEKKLSVEAKKALLKYRWPGNIRELKNIMQNVVILSMGEEIIEDEIPEIVRETSEGKRTEKRVIEEIELKEYMKQREREYMEYMVSKYGENKSEMARVMGVTRKTIYEKIAEYNLEKK